MSKAKKKAIPSAKKKVPQLKKKAAPALSVVANATSFELRDNVPVPAISRRSNGPATIYPFASMTVGKSFFVSSAIDASTFTDETEAAKAQGEATKTVANRLSGAVRRFTKKNEGYKFNVRATVEDGVPGVYVGRVE